MSPKPFSLILGNGHWLGHLFNIAGMEHVHYRDLSSSVGLPECLLLAWGWWISKLGYIGLAE